MHTRWIVPLALSLAVCASSRAAESSLRIDDTASLAISCRSLGTGTPSASRRSPGGEPSDLVLCLGYMQAMQDVAALANEEGRPIIGSCPPRHTTLLQMVDIFLTYARNNRAESGGNAATAVVRSLQDAFPCASTGQAPAGPETSTHAG